MPRVTPPNGGKSGLLSRDDRVCITCRGERAVRSKECVTVTVRSAPPPPSPPPPNPPLPFIAPDKLEVPSTLILTTDLFSTINIAATVTGYKHGGAVTVGDKVVCVSFTPNDVGVVNIQAIST